ncbi:Mitochondrial translocator assembly and maintenance protein 41 [Ascosphaera aggregata]|nr:Mitochondrial translocator assembly and maintenance protein 41 [Ascosphaera aggregata]
MRRGSTLLCPSHHCIIASRQLQFIYRPSRSLRLYNTHINSSDHGLLSSVGPRFPHAEHLRPVEARSAYTKRSSSSPSASSLNWEDDVNPNISTFSELPFKSFGVNQHMRINEEFKEVLRQILWQFRAPIRYAFAYGSGVFAQTGNASGMSRVHPSAPESVQKMQKAGAKMIDFIFGVSYTQHWHDINLRDNRSHYSGLGSLGSYAVSQIQDKMGAGVYFNPYITVNGVLIKYGVVSIERLCNDLSNWETLYLAGRLQKPVKILRDHPKVRLANQINLLSAVRVALLLLPPTFTEHQLYSTIAGISYLGDPRMSLAGENPDKVNNIVTSQMDYFRRLYAPLIDAMPNVSYDDPKASDPSWVDDPTINVSMSQDMDPIKRGNMVRRLPRAFRDRLYFQYQSRFGIPRGEFNNMMEMTIMDGDSERFYRRDGGEFERRIASDEEHLREEVGNAIKKTVSWPSITQSVKSFFTAGTGRSLRYMGEKRQKYRSSQGSPGETNPSGVTQIEQERSSSKEIEKSQ